MEKVFSKVLPQFVDHVNELSRITERVKSPPSPRLQNRPRARIARDEE